MVSALFFLKPNFDVILAEEFLLFAAGILPSSILS